MPYPSRGPFPPARSYPLCLILAVGFWLEDNGTIYRGRGDLPWKKKCYSLFQTGFSPVEGEILLWGDLKERQGFIPCFLLFTLLFFFFHPLEKGTREVFSTFTFFFICSSSDFVL